MNSKYKFLDVGAKIGGSFNIAKKRGYNPADGIGMDINPKRVETMKSLGYNAIVGDATNIPFEDNTFELVIFSHVLEHMKGPTNGKKALDECLRVCAKTLVIRLPFFDEDKYLNSLGLKTFYSDWHGHSNKVHLSTLKDEWLKGYSIKLTMTSPITGSGAPEILPIDAPMDSHEYNPDIHSVKPAVNFDRPIWKEYEIIVNK